MIKKLTPVPRIGEPGGKKDTVEWHIPDKVSAAFMFTPETGYSFIAKVRIEKKRWWSRPWETFITHSPDQAEAARKGMEFLETHGYTIDPDEIRLEEAG